MSFGQWLRSNSEHYLLIDAQGRTAAKYGLQAPARPKGAKDRFWRQVFTPIYRLLPWGVRRRTIQALPGSHRRSWPPGRDRSRDPAV